MTDMNHTETEPEQSLNLPDGSSIPNELVDLLLKDYKSPEDLIGENGLLKQLTAALVNRALQAEISHHLGYQRGEKPPEGQANRRNGSSPKKLRSDQGTLQVQVPRDRQGTFEPQLVARHDREFRGFDDKILAMYSRGMSTRDIRAHIREIYAVDVSPDLVSRVTDEVLDELKEWQQRPLESTYAVVYLDALVVKIRDKGVVQNKSIYLVVGVLPDGSKDLLGMWVQNTEGAKFWLAILSELKQRGVQDILVICADGLTGMAQAAEAAFPQAIFQTCVVHMIRNSVRFVPHKERKEVCGDLKAVYTAVNEEEALDALERFETRWGRQYPMVAKAWRDRWDEVAPFLSFPEEIRKVIYTTNAIEALNRQFRKVLKTRGHMPNEQAALKLLFLSYRNAKKKWGHPHRLHWSQARRQFAIYFGERFPG